MTFWDLKHKDLTEPKTQLNPDTIFFREVDMSDLSSQYTEDIETFRQVFNIPDPRDSMPVSSASMWGPSAMLQASPTLKEAV